MPLDPNKIRSVAHKAVTEGVNLKYVEEMRKVLYDAADEIERLRGGIHSAVSFSYINTEKARIQSRIDLKTAAGWPLTDEELERIKELSNE